LVLHFELSPGDYISAGLGGDMCVFLNRQAAAIDAGGD
jgi:hypothetical protein